MVEGYPDSGNPADYTDEQLTALSAMDKGALSKNQKAAVARWKFAKTPAAATPAPAPAAAPAAGPAPTGWPEGQPVPDDVKPLLERDFTTLSQEERIKVAKAKSQAAKAAMAAKAGPGEAKAEAKGPSAEEVAREKARAKAAEFPWAKELKDRFPDGVEDLGMQHDKPLLLLKAAEAPKVLRYAKDVLGFDHLACLTAADFPPDRIEVVYNLYSYPKRRHLAAKVRLPRDGEGCAVPTVTHLWGGADWLEREVLDMYGVRFPGHPNPTRLLLPEGWEGYPLRKDYDATKEQFVSVDERGDDVVGFEEREGW